MPKALWGAGDNPLTAADIDNAEVQETRTRYSGEVPPGGTYRWVIGSIKKAQSNAGNDKILIRLELDGSWRGNHKQYNGAPVWHHLALTVPNAPNVRNFLDAIGGNSNDLMKGSIVDENGYITKLGRVGDPAGLLVFANVKRRKRTAEYPDPALEVEFAGYMPVGDDTSEGAEPPAGNADEEPPF
jgi:hypothetical protein